MFHEVWVGAIRCASDAFVVINALVAVAQFLNGYREPSRSKGSLV